MMKITRHRFVRTLAAAFGLAVAGAATPALAQSAKPIHILVGFPAGGGTDAIARLLAERMKDELGATLIVENKPGAGGQLAAQALKAAPADGSTFFISHDHTISILPLVVKNPGFDPSHDFVPVAGFATFVNAFAVSGQSAAKSFDGWVDGVRGQGGKSAVGVPAPASVPEFLVKVIGEKYRLDLVSAPYRGSAPMLADLLGNQIPAAIASTPELVEPHKSGKLRVLAVLGGARQPSLPEVPTFAELGLAGFEDKPYYAFFAPAGTPKATLDAFANALEKTIATPAVRERLTSMGLAVEFMPGPALAAREKAYSQVWAGIIRKSGFQPQ